MHRGQTVSLTTGKKRKDSARQQQQTRAISLRRGAYDGCERRIHCDMHSFPYALELGNFLSLAVALRGFGGGDET